MWGLNFIPSLHRRESRNAPATGKMKKGGLSLAGATKLSLSFSGRSKKAAAAASSVDAGLTASVNHDNRPTASRVDPIDMQVGDLALQFKDGGWTSTDTAGNARTLTAPGQGEFSGPGSRRPDTSPADKAEIERVKRENEALRGEVRMPRRRTRLWRVTPHTLVAHGSLC